MRAMAVAGIGVANRHGLWAEIQRERARQPVHDELGDLAFPQGQWQAAFVFRFSAARRGATKRR